MHPCRQVRGGRGKVATARPRHQMHVRAGPIGRPRVTGQRDLRTAFRYDGALHVPGHVLCSVVLALVGLVGPQMAGRGAPSLPTQIGDPVAELQSCCLP